jgi:hypothetical protein
MIKITGVGIGRGRKVQERGQRVIHRKADRRG